MSLASLLAVTIALFAVLRFWTVPVAYRRGDPPWSALWPSPMGGINAIETVKRCAVFPIAELVRRLHPRATRMGAFQGCEVSNSTH
jgi:hypothetical protein